MPDMGNVIAQDIISRCLIGFHWRTLIYHPTIAATSVIARSKKLVAISVLFYATSICTTNSKAMSHYGCCETDFKVRSHNHKQNFKTSSKIRDTKQSFQSLFSVSRMRVTFRVIKRSIVCKAKPYSSGAMHCQLCLAEKLAILRSTQTPL